MHQQHVNCLINTWVLPVKTWLVIACDIGFYAIIKVNTSTQYVVYASGKRSGEFAYFCRLTGFFDAQYCDKNQNLTMLALFYELLYHVYIAIKYYS